MKWLFKLIVLSSCLKFYSQKQPELTRILFVFDASQSMWAKWESDTRINIAKKVMLQMLDSIATLENVELALRVYGHQKPVPPQDCSDTRLEVPFKKNNIDEIKAVIKKIEPKGTTPIAYSLESAALDFPKASPSRNIIILITDGIEACDGDPCLVSEKLQKEGIILKPFIIGIGLDPGLKKSFDCVGKYFDAGNETKFQEVLGIVIQQALSNTTLQINFLDANENPTETDIPMTFYDKKTGKPRHSYIHTLNHLGNPDTLVIDPWIDYNLTAFTIPPVYIDSIKLTPGKHSIFGTFAPQGLLQINGNAQFYKDVPIIIRLNETSKILHVTKIKETTKLLKGDYYIEVLTLPRLYFNVNIKPNHTTTVQLPTPGFVTFLLNAPGYGAILVERDNKLEWVINLDEQQLRQTFTLLPGNYRVVWRAKNSKKTIFSIEKKFSVVSNTSIVVNLK
ncbi:MAG: VWA domain-containing protein [Bacteroidales bacterium]|nr:VWA domain-containing protein [Bacteroidales bacterium]